MTRRASHIDLETQASFRGRHASLDAPAFGGRFDHDDARLVTDVPLHTLTMLQGTQDSKAHTFSYWLGDGEFAAVDALLEDFIVEHFP